MMRQNGYARYREQTVLTSDPGGLVMMLYDGCLKEIRLALHAQEEGFTAQYSRHLIKAQDILAELINGLDFEYDLSRDLYRLYEFMSHELMLANVEGASERVPAIVAMLEDLRQTWTQVVRQTRQEQTSERLISSVR